MNTMSNDDEKQKFKKNKTSVDHSGVDTEGQVKFEHILIKNYTNYMQKCLTPKKKTYFLFVSYTTHVSTAVFSFIFKFIINNFIIHINEVI